MRFIDLSGLPVTWTKIGTIPKVMSGTFSNNPFTCIVNGYFSVFFPVGQGGNPQTNMGGILFSFDGLGNMCTYQTSDYSVTGTQNALCRPFQIWQNNNTLVWAQLNGGTWSMTIPPVFTPGFTYILPATPFPTPAPCGAGGYQQTIFCSQQGLYCNEFIQDFPESDNYWASIYDHFGNFINGGFIGNSASDLFDQRAIQLPPFVTINNIYDRNGLTLYGNFNLVSSSLQVVGTLINWLNGNINSLICGGGGTTSVYVSGKSPQQIYYNRDYGMPAFGTNPDFAIMGSTDMLGNILFPDGVLKLLSGWNYIQLPTKTPQAPAAYLYSKKQLFNAVGYAPNTTNDVYMASLDLSQYTIPATVTNSAHNTLTNFARPISVKGSYVT